MALSKIQSESINLTDSFAFTGTVTGVGGITMADFYRLNADLSGDADPITNIEKVDNSMAGFIGTGMTLSSGIFTFPQTGIYKIDFMGVIYDAGTDDLQTNSHIEISTDSGSSYTIVAVGMTNLHNASQNSFATSFTVDVTNASTFRCKFVVEGNNGQVQSNTNRNITNMSFIRLGDT